MGMRLHVHKKHVIEYADIEAFNYKYNDFQYLLDTLGCSTTPDVSDFPDSFEVDEGEYKRALNALKTIKEHPELAEITIEPLNENESEVRLDVSEEIMDEVDGCYSDQKTPREKLDQLIEDMQGFYDAADKTDGYLHFDAF